MYYQNYEDYMRSVLGYPIENRNTYRMHYFQNNQNEMEIYQNINNLYPAVYNIINPIICDVCDKYTNTITEELIDSIEKEVYSKINFNNEIFIKINIENVNAEKVTNNQRNNMNESRKDRPNNPLLRDLIRILIIKRLLENNQRRMQNIPRNIYSQNYF